MITNVFHTHIPFQNQFSKTNKTQFYTSNMFINAKRKGIQLLSRMDSKTYYSTKYVYIAYAAQTRYILKGDISNLGHEVLKFAIRNID